MNVTLEQAIEIHGRSLWAKFGERGQAAALERAACCRDVGDLEGHDVWTRVAEIVKRLSSGGIVKD